MSVQRKTKHPDLSVIFVADLYMKNELRDLYFGVILMAGKQMLNANVLFNLQKR